MCLFYLFKTSSLINLSNNFLIDNVAKRLFDRTHTFLGMVFVEKLGELKVCFQNCRRIEAGESRTAAVLLDLRLFYHLKRYSKLLMVFNSA
jgi:hypothetical protein